MIGGEGGGPVTSAAAPISLIEVAWNPRLRNSRSADSKIGSRREGRPRFGRLARLVVIRAPVGVSAYSAPELTHWVRSINLAMA